MAEQLWLSSCVNLTTQKRQFTFAWEEDLLLYVVQATKGSYKSSCLTAEALHKMKIQIAAQQLKTAKVLYKSDVNGIKLYLRVGPQAAV
jgi:hypothetical protein